MSYTKKVFLVSGIIAVVVFVLFTMAALLGNPVSYFLVKHNAQQHLQETYTETDYTISDVVYHFKDGNYYVKVVSPSSEDSTFFLAYSLSGKFLKDSFTQQVVRRYNTYERLNSEYTQLVQSVFSSEGFPIETDTAYGRLRQLREADTDHLELDFGIPTSELKLDGEYDVRELGSQFGSIVFYAYDEEVTVERASELMFTIRQALSKANVPFYALTFHLQKPLNADGTPNADSTSIDVIDFLYSDLYSYELESRVGGAARRAAAMLEQQTAGQAEDAAQTE